ncbi:hypothetical protein [Methanopyrus kandleri]
MPRKARLGGERDHRGEGPSTRAEDGVRVSGGDARRRDAEGDELEELATEILEEGDVERTGGSRPERPSGPSG